MLLRLSVKARPIVMAALLVAVVPGCGTSEPGDAPPTSALTIVAEGAELYAANCAACHGSNLEGVADWQVANDDGSYKPPPHDTSGHTWHHGDLTLLQIISEGSGFAQSQMPVFGDELSDAEILKTLEFIKTSWGPEERKFQLTATLRELEAASK